MPKIGTETVAARIRNQNRMHSRTTSIYHGVSDLVIGWCLRFFFSKSSSDGLLSRRTVQQTFFYGEYGHVCWTGGCMLSIIEPEKKISKKIADGRGKCCVQPHRALSVWKVCHAFRLQLVQHTGGECRRDIFCICSDRYLVEPSLALPILRGIPVTLQQFLVGVLSASLFFFF